MRTRLGASGISAAIFLFCAASKSNAAAASKEVTVLESVDHGFLMTIPGAWLALESPDSGIVLLAARNHAEIRVRALPQPLSEKALKAKVLAAYKTIKKSGAALTKKIFSMPAGADGKLFFLQFSSKGKNYCSGYFNFDGRSYGLLTTNFSAAQFKAALKSIVPAPEPTPPAPVPPPISTAPSAAPVAAPVAAVATSSAALGAPPTETTFGAQAPEHSKELAPLPKRNVGGSLFIFLVCAVISAAALGYRAFAHKKAELDQEPPPAAGAVFPFHITRHYLSFPIVFDVQDAAGQSYRGVSSRIPALIFGAGLGIYFFIHVLLQLAAFAGFSVANLDRGVLLPLAGLLSLSNLLMVVGGFFTLILRKKLKIYDGEGNLVFDIRQKLVTFSSLKFLICDAAGKQLAMIRRSGFVLVRRRWQLLDNEENVLLDFQEDSALRSIARRIFGHLWGLLRTNYVISTVDAKAGDMTREWSIGNRCKLHLTPFADLDPKLALATALFIDIVDPDRWYPWHA